MKTPNGLGEKRVLAGVMSRLVGGSLGPLLALVVVISFFAVADHFQEGRDTFLTAQNLRTVAVQEAPTAIAALGMTVVIISGGIDLSAGTSMALCATVLAWALRADYSPAAAVGMCLATGCLAGFVNGTLISLLRVDRKSTRLNSSHIQKSRMPSSA